MDVNNGDGRHSKKNDTADADNGDGRRSEKQDITGASEASNDHKGTHDMHDNSALSDAVNVTTAARHPDGPDARSETNNTRSAPKPPGDKGLSITNLLNPDPPKNHPREPPVNQNPGNSGDDGRHGTWIPIPGKDDPCDFCTKRPKGMLQKCSQCSTKICEACIVKGSLNSYPDHFIDPKELSWEIAGALKKTKIGRPSKAAAARRASAAGDDDGNWGESRPKTKARLANQVTGGDDEPAVRKRQRHSMSPPPDTALTAASGRSAVRASAAMAVHKMSKPVRPYWDRANSPDEEEQDDDEQGDYQEGPTGPPASHPQANPQANPQQAGDFQPGGPFGIRPPNQYDRVGSQPVPPPGLPPQGHLQRPGSSQSVGPQPSGHVGIPPSNPYGHVGPQPGVPPGAPPGIPPPVVQNPTTRPPRRQVPARRAAANQGPYNGPFSSRPRERQVTILYQEMFGGERYHPQALFITDLPRRIDEPAMMAQDPRRPAPPGISITGPSPQQQGQQGQQGYQQPLPTQGQQNYLRPPSAQSQHDHQRPRSAHGPQDYQRPPSAQSQHDHQRPPSAHGPPDYQRPPSAQSQGQGQHNNQRPLSAQGQLSGHGQHHREIQTYMMTGGHFDPARQLPPQPPGYANTAFHNYPNQNQYMASARSTPVYNPMNELHPEQIRLMHEDQALAVKVAEAWINNPRVLRVRQLGLKAFGKTNLSGIGSGPEDYEALKLLWEVALMRMGRVVLPTAPQTTKLFVDELQKIFFLRRAGDGDGDGDGDEMDIDGDEDEDGGEVTEYDDGRDGEYNPRR